MANKKSILLFTGMLSILCVSMCAAILGNRNISQGIKAQDKSQVLVLDESNAPLRGGSGESVINTTGGGDLTIRYESPSLKEGGTEHFTCWGTGSMKNTLPIKGMTSIAVEGTGMFEIRAGRSYDIYDDFIYARFSSYGTATLTIPETADYFCIYAANGEMHVKTVTINCSCVANEAWADDGDMLIGATHVYHANEVVSNTAGSASAIRTQRQTSETNGSASALRVWTEVSGAYPWLVLDIPGLDTTKYEYQVDVKLISGQTSIISSWRTIESGAEGQTVGNSTLAVDEWRTIYFSSAELVGTQFVLSLSNSHGPFEFVLDNFQVRNYATTTLSHFDLGTSTKYDFASKVTMEYKCEDSGYIRMGLGNYTCYVGYLKFYNGDWGSDKTVGGVTLESIDNGYTRVTILLEEVNYSNGGYGKAIVREAVESAFSIVFISGSSTSGADIRKFVVEANASSDLASLMGKSIALAQSEIDATTTINKVLSFEYKLVTNTVQVRIVNQAGATDKYIGLFTFSSDGGTYDGITVSDTSDGFKRVEINLDNVTRFANGSDVSKKPDTIYYLYFRNSSATGEIRRISIKSIS